MAPSKASTAFTQQGILALEFVDVISKQPCHAVCGTFGPAGLYVMHLVAKDTLEGGWKFANQLLEEAGNVGLQPTGCLVTTGTEEQQKMRMRSHA